MSHFDAKNLYSLNLIPSLAVLLVASSSFGMGKSHPKVGTVQFEKHVPDAQYERLAADLKLIETMDLSTHASPEMLKIMTLDSASPQSLNTWLTDRVRYILPEDFEFGLWTVTVEKSPYEYPNPGQLPVIEPPKKTPDGNSTVKTVMSNIGGALYIAGKSNNFLLGLRLSGIGTVPVSTPRVGILKVGEGLLASPTKNPDEFAPDSKARFAFRMSTLFHEARHSDGNGESLGFLHKTCTEGYYEGYAACDGNLNGPYSVGAQILQAYAHSCSDCSAKELEFIRLLEADAFSRVIQVAPDSGVASSYWDPTPEGSL